MNDEKESFNPEYAWVCWEIVQKKLEPLALIDKTTGKRKICLAGSYRRKRPVCHDIDIVIIPKEGVEPRDINREFAKACYTEGSLGTHKSVGWVAAEPDATMPVNLFFTTVESWGAALMRWTGSKPYNNACSWWAETKGLLANEYGIFRRDPRELIPGSGASEGSYCRALGIPRLQPWDREVLVPGQFRQALFPKKVTE